MMLYKISVRDFDRGDYDQKFFTNEKDARKWMGQEKKTAGVGFRGDITYIQVAMAKKHIVDLLNIHGSYPRTDQRSTKL